MALYSIPIAVKSSMHWLGDRELRRAKGSKLIRRRSGDIVRNLDYFRLLSCFSLHLRTV